MPVSFFDEQRGLSALAIQHVSANGRMVIVYHDAPSPAAARAALGRVAETLAAELAPGQLLGLIECCVPEHEAEPFIYARATVSSVPGSGRVDVGATRVVSVEAVARACGIEAREVERTELLVATVHRPRRCAFPGFRQLRLGERARRDVVAA